MATKRMTGKDYKKEFSELNNKTRSLEAKVNERLLELTSKYPEVDLPCSRAGGLKCKEINHKWIIEETTLSAKIEYIETIEKHIADSHPHKQVKIAFPTEAIRVIPGSPESQRVMISAGKAYSRKPNKT